MASITDNVTKVNFVNGSTTTELNLVKVNLNGTIYYKYVKAFTYTAGSKTGVSTITCTRASSPYAGAATGTVASGGTIYYGDTIYFTATAVSGYTVTSSVTVDNPMTVSSNVTGVNYITVTPNNYSLTITEFATGVNYIHVKIGSGSYTQYSDQGTFTISVPFNSTVYIYDTVASGYTAKYTQSVPLVFTMGTSGYTYSPVPATSTLTLTKNTGVASIYYKVNGATSWTQTTTSTTVSVNYNTTVYWYAPGETGYSRNDSYTSSSSYATISNFKVSQTVSPTATRLTYSFTVTLSDYVTEFKYSTDNTNWTASTATKTFSNVDYATTYYIKPTAYGVTDAQYTYTWVQGSTATSTLTYSSHANITYKQSRTINKYAVTITGGTGISAVYLSTNSSATSGDASGTTYNYNTTVYGFVTLSNNTAQYTYTPQSNWTLVSGRTYRVGSVTTTAAKSFGTLNAVRTTNKYAVTITAGTGVSAVYLSTSSTATSGSASGTTYDYNTTVYGFATLANDTAQYTYTAPSGWTLVSGRTYRVGSVATTSAQNFGTMNATRTTNKYAVNFTLGNYVTNAFLSTSSSATSGSASGTTYDYGTTVYYFVTKYANSTEYTYTCSGTQVSGNVYRLGSVIVDGTENLGALSSVTRTPNNFNLWIMEFASGITSVYVKIGSGSYVQYTDQGEAQSVSVPYDSTVNIYTTVTNGYTAVYTQSVPLVFTMTTAGYTYNPVPKECAISFQKNTGVSAIYYKVNGASSWTSITSSANVWANYNSTLYWYAPASTGYTRDDSYTSSSSYATVSMSQRRVVSPTATINKYAVTFTLGSYVTSAFTSTNANATSGNPSGTQYNYGSTVYYFVEKYADTAAWIYTCSGTHISGNIYRLGSVSVTSAQNLGTLSSVTRTANMITYTIKVAAITNSMISPYYICSDSNDYDELVSQAGLGPWVIKQFTTTVQRRGDLTEVYLSQSTIQQQLPGSYVYTGGTITFTANPNNPYLYVGVYVYDDDH